MRLLVVVVPLLLPAPAPPLPLLLLLGGDVVHGQLHAFLGGHTVADLFQHATLPDDQVRAEHRGRCLVDTECLQGHTVLGAVRQQMVWQLVLCLPVQLRRGRVSRHAIHRVALLHHRGRMVTEPARLVRAACFV